MILIVATHNRLIIFTDIFNLLPSGFIYMPQQQDDLYDFLFDEIKKDRDLKDKAPLLGDLFMINEETETKVKKIAAYERLLKYFSHRSKWDEEIVQYLSNRYAKIR